MTPRRPATIAFVAASIAALVAGTVPSVAATVRTEDLLRVSAAVRPAADPLTLRPATGPVAGLRTGFLHVPDLGGGAHRVRVGVVEPSGAPVADLLFLHGHADRLDNHAALFAGLRAAGVRVVSFDLPSHGETDAGPIDRWTFDDLGALAARVARVTEQDPERPFVIAGWSFGGLLAARSVQDPAVRSAFGRPVAALALESPAVVPRTFAGGDGISRLRALTHDLRAPVAGPPDPASPFLDPVFAGRLVAQAGVAVATPLPDGLPTLVELGDHLEDRYVDVRAVRAWAVDVAPRSGADVRVVQCDGARHGLDIEAWPVGDSARAQLVSFVTRAVGAAGPAGAPAVGVDRGEAKACR